MGAVSPGIERILGEMMGAMDRQCPDGWDTVVAQSDSASVLHEGSRTRVVRVPALAGNWFRHWNLAYRVLRREDLRRRSAHRATELSWETCADATWSTVERAVRRYRERRYTA